MKELINRLYSNDNNFAYEALKELEFKAFNSKEIYQYFDEFLTMLNHDKSYIRIRGYRLICASAKWDLDSKINKNIQTILKVLDDNKGIIIRDALKKIHLIFQSKPELSLFIKEKLKTLNLSQYSESMKRLIEKDIIDILDNR